MKKKHGPSLKGRDSSLTWFANPLKLLQAGNNVCAWGHGEVCVIPGMSSEEAKGRKSQSSGY